MTLKPPGPHMEASARVKAVCDMAGAVTVNPETHPKHYLRSGRELIRSAASYQEDGQIEHAYILFIRFLTIFLDKLRSHPNYKEVPAAERKVMSEYCNKIFPQAEYLKKELLKKYEKEHEEYQVQVEKFRKQAEEQRQRELEEQQRLAKEKAMSGATGASTSGGYSPPPPYDPDMYSSYNITPNAPTTGLPPLIQPSAPVANPWGFDDIPQSVPGSLPPEAAGGVPMPSVDRSTKPSRFLTPMSTGLRPLIVPGNLSETFLRLASSNTAKNVETCGFLTGKISGSRLIITDLIIPKQTGTSDTCTTLNESEIFALQDQYNLITFGWIHTHPSQTAFLSSVDMHTHYSYQIMMPEAIAIVCAPKHNQTGIFILTPTEGMEVIGSCNLNGFHPHKATGLFGDAPHCTIDSSVSVKIHDLR